MPAACGAPNGRNHRVEPYPGGVDTHGLQIMDGPPAATGDGGVQTPPDGGVTGQSLKPRRKGWRGPPSMRKTTKGSVADMKVGWLVVVSPVWRSGRCGLWIERSDQSQSVSDRQRRRRGRCSGGRPWIGAGNAADEQLERHERRGAPGHPRRRPGGGVAGADLHARLRVDPPRLLWGRRLSQPGEQGGGQLLHPDERLHFSSGAESCREGQRIQSSTGWSLPGGCPSGPRLSADALQLLSDWIDAGAFDD